MPLYEYVCQDCESQAELLVQGSQQPECPKCGSAKLTKLLSVVAAPGRDASAGEHARGPGRLLRLRAAAAIRTDQVVRLDAIVREGEAPAEPKSHRQARQAALRPAGKRPKIDTFPAP